MSNSIPSKAPTVAKRPVSPLPDSSASNKRRALDPDLTVEKELHHILNLFERREIEKEERFNEWVENGLSLSSCSLLIFRISC